MPAATTPLPSVHRRPAPAYRTGAAVLAAAIVVALAVWVPLVDELRAPCGRGIAAASCRQPAAVLRWAQYLAGIVTAILGVVTVGALAAYAVRGRWVRHATRVATAFAAAAASWLVLYLVSLPGLV